MLRSYPLDLQRPGLHFRLVYNPPAFVREANLITLLIWIATTTKPLEGPASLRDIQSERSQYWNDPTLAIACACAQNTKHEMFGAYRAVVDDAPRFILCESEHALRVVVI